MVYSLSFTAAFEWDHRCKDGLSHVDNNLDVNNMTTKNF